MDEMVLKFQQIAKERWQYLEEGNARKGNRCSAQLKKIATELKEKHAIGELIALLDDPADSVRYETAVELLPVSQYTQKSEEVLEKIGEGRGMLPFTAREDLAFWRSGEWILDY